MSDLTICITHWEIMTNVFVFLILIDFLSLHFHYLHTDLYFNLATKSHLVNYISVDILAKPLFIHIYGQYKRSQNLEQDLYLSAIG